MERSSGLFDASSNLYRTAVCYFVGLLLFFVACGLIWEYGYMRHWKKKAEMGKIINRKHACSVPFPTILNDVELG